MVLQVRGAEVKEEENFIVLPADHTAHNAIHGIVDNLPGDLIGLVGSYVGFERERTFIGRSPRLIYDLVWTSADALVTVDQGGHQTKYTLESEDGSSGTVCWTRKKRVVPPETKVIIHLFEGGQWPKKYSPTLMINQGDGSEFKVQLEEKTYSLGPMKDLAAISWNKQGNKYAVADCHGLSIWDDETSERCPLDQEDYTKRHDDMVDSNISWNPTNSTLAVTDGRMVKICDIKNKECVKLAIPYMSLSDKDLEGNYMQVMRDKGGFVDGANGNDTKLENYITSFSWSPSGDKLAIGCLSYYCASYLYAHGRFDSRHRCPILTTIGRLLVFANYEKILPELLTSEKRTELQRKKQSSWSCIVQ